LEEDHTTVLSDVVDGDTVAVRVALWPTSSVSSAGDTATLRGKTSCASFSEEQAMADIRAVAKVTALRSIFIVIFMTN
jgi:chorismate synthase